MGVIHTVGLSIIFTKGMLIHKNRKNSNLCMKVILQHSMVSVDQFVIKECECHRPHLALPREHRAEVMDLAPLDATLSKRITTLHSSRNLSINNSTTMGGNVLIVQIL